MSEAVAVAGLKSFGRTRALEVSTVSVEAGEVHGFLGPNGAGETTTIRVLPGLLRTDAGTARLLGGDPRADAEALHRRPAYVPGGHPAVAGAHGGRDHRPARAPAGGPRSRAPRHAAGALRPGRGPERACSRATAT